MEIDRKVGKWLFGYVRASKVLLFLVGFIVIISVALFFYFSEIGPGSRYHRFQNHDTKYYSRLARACDQLLQEHPNFTKTDEKKVTSENYLYTWLDYKGVLWNQVRLSPKDSSIPGPIRDLKPDKVQLAPGRAFLCFGESRLAWTIVWEQDDLQTNKWRLYSSAEGYHVDFYTEIK